MWGGERPTTRYTSVCERDMLRPDSSQQTETAETVSRMCVIAHIGGSFYTREQTRNDYCLLLFSRTESHPLALAQDARARRHAASLRVRLQALGAPPLLNGEPGIIVAAK